MVFGASKILCSGEEFQVNLNFTFCTEFHRGWKKVLFGFVPIPPVAADALEICGDFLATSPAGKPPFPPSTWDPQSPKMLSFEGNHGTEMLIALTIKGAPSMLSF